MIHRYIIEATDEVKGFEEAIEQLDREWGIEELEPCEDAISREQAKSDYADWYGYGYSDNTFYKHLCSIPPVTPQPKMGRWIDNHNNTMSCDRCHTWFNKDDRYGYMHYCPNCGAKMQEVTE